MHDKHLFNQNVFWEAAKSFGLKTNTYFGCIFASKMHENIVVFFNQNEHFWSRNMPFGLNKCRSGPLLPSQNDLGMITSRLHEGFIKASWEKGTDSGPIVGNIHPKHQFRGMKMGAGTHTNRFRANCISCTHSHTKTILLPSSRPCL